MARLAPGHDLGAQDVTVKSRIKDMARERLHLRVFAERSLPRGVDRFLDVRMAFPDLEFDTILDVGANVGQSAERFLMEFPDALIYCFEPGDEAFALLSRKYGHLGRVRCLDIALADFEGDGSVMVGETSDLTRLVRDPGSRPPVGARTVPVTTVDAYCASSGIARINYLKVDTEGGDLAVIEGADRMIGLGAIDLIEVEVGLNPCNSWHVPLAEMQGHLERRGCYLFGFYEQASERGFSGASYLRRANALFVSTALA